MRVVVGERWYKPVEPVRTPRQQVAELLRLPVQRPKIDLLKARREAFTAEMRLDTARRWPFWVKPDPRTTRDLGLRENPAPEPPPPPPPPAKPGKTRRNPAKRPQTAPGNP